MSASAFGTRIRLKPQHRRPSSSTLKRTMEASGSTGKAGGATQPTEQRAMKAKRAMKTMKTMKKRKSGAATRKRLIEQHKASCTAALAAGCNSTALYHLCVAKKNQSKQAKNFKKKRAKWNKEQAAGNTGKPKPYPSSPIPRIPPALEALAAQTKKAQKQCFREFVTTAEMAADI